VLLTQKSKQLREKVKR